MHLLIHIALNANLQFIYTKMHLTCSKCAFSNSHRNLCFNIYVGLLHDPVMCSHAIHYALSPLSLFSWLVAPYTLNCQQTHHNHSYAAL